MSSKGPTDSTAFERPLGSKAFLYVAVALLYAPVILVVFFSFNAAKHGMVWQGASFQGYLSLLRDPAVLRSLYNTIVVSAIAVFVSVVGGLGCGYLLSTIRGRLFYPLAALLFLPIVTPDLIAALAQALAYQSVGIEKGVLSIALSIAYFGISYVAVFIAVSMKAVDFQALRIAAASLGANPGHLFLHHYLPLARGPAVAGAFLVLALSVQDFLFAYFCGGAGSTTLSVRLYGMVKFGVNSNMNAMYTLLLVFAVALAAAAESVQQRRSTNA